MLLSSSASKLLLCFLVRSQKKMNSSSWKPAPTKVPGYGLQVRTRVSHSFQQQIPGLGKSKS